MNDKSCRSVFITRSLNEDDPLWSGIVSKGIEVKAFSLIRIIPLPYAIPQKPFDWIFLSSSNAVSIFLPNYEGNAKIAVTGNATANACRSFGYNPDFIGSGGDMLKVGEAFSKVLKNETVLFPCAESGSGRIRTPLVPSQFHVLPIYKTEGVSQPDIPDTDIVLLTSPSNAEVFLKHSSVSNKIIVAIGHTTKDHLISKNVADVRVPDQPTTAAIVELICLL